MEQALGKYFMWVLIIMSKLVGNKGCFEEERMGLLAIKAFVIKSHNEEADHLLSSWVDDGVSDYCGWERVKCSSTTGQVVELSLKNTTVGSLLLNVSLFHPFEELQSLDLSFNRLSGWVEDQGSKRLSRFKKLENLNLESNSFNMSILRSLGALTSLKNLSLSSNGLKGSFPTQELASLENLEMLDLSFNELNGSLPIQELANMSNLKILNLRQNQFNGPLPTQGLTNFKNLEVLDLGENEFVGIIPPFIGNLTSLKALSLVSNYLNGSLLNQGLCELKNLQELDLSVNHFEGLLPPCLNSLTSLRLLDLSKNQLEGNISSFPIASLISLEYIDLSQNFFEGLFFFSSFANHSMLKVVIFSDNNKLKIETEASSWVPKFQLTILALSNCNLNRLNNEIPKFLLYQFKLRGVDLSHNNLTGRFPNWLLENITGLEILNLRNNSLRGQFHLTSSSKISWIDISDNHFHGQLQENIGEMFPSTMYDLNVSQNSFEGSIPPSIGNLTSLQYLDLSSNNFLGEVPAQLAIGCSNLEYLTLSNNRLQGQILSLHFNATTLRSLRLDNNQFTGNLSNGVFSQWSYLRDLEVSNNYMSGEIPSWISNMTDLASLSMRNNSFEGQIPCAWASRIEFVDLSYNSLSGSLPSCQNLFFLKHIHLQGNRITGSIPKKFLSNSSSLLTLSISDNNLSGRIPNLIGVFYNLRVLLLKGNHLSGLIPDELCRLHKIGIMDLSHNILSGSIPSCLNNISFGKIDANDLAFVPKLYFQSSRTSSYVYEAHVENVGHAYDKYDTYGEQSEVEIVTKNRLSIYKGGILDFMSGLDLSCNNLTGEIPHEIGHLSWIRALNLSHNQLTGSIPKAFSSLTQIESLDLSHNNLSGKIPSELTDLFFLGVFTVAYNNLSGIIPEVKQFGTFNVTSYEGNPFLCGLLLEKNCTIIFESPHLPMARPDETEGKWYEIDRSVFFASFFAAYIMFLLGFTTLLYVKPYWQQSSFNLIEECMYSCYHFASDTLNKLSTRLYN